MWHHRALDNDLLEWCNRALDFGMSRGSTGADERLQLEDMIDVAEFSEPLLEK
jgi:hypothetical protein